MPIFGRRYNRTKKSVVRKVVSRMPIRQGIEAKDRVPDGQMVDLGSASFLRPWGLNARHWTKLHLPRTPEEAQRYLRH